MRRAGGKNEKEQNLGLRGIAGSERRQAACTQRGDGARPQLSSGHPARQAAAASGRPGEAEGRGAPLRARRARPSCARNGSASVGSWALLASGAGGSCVRCQPITLRERGPRKLPEKAGRCWPTHRGPPQGPSVAGKRAESGRSRPTPKLSTYSSSLRFGAGPALVHSLLFAPA